MRLPLGQTPWCALSSWPSWFKCPALDAARENENYIAAVWRAGLFSDTACVAEELALEGVGSLLQAGRNPGKPRAEQLSLGALLKCKLLLLQD